jgi:hypothetical protein
VFYLCNLEILASSKGFIFLTEMPSYSRLDENQTKRVKPETTPRKGHPINPSSLDHDIRDLANLVGSKESIFFKGMNRMILGHRIAPNDNKPN